MPMKSFRRPRCVTVAAVSAFVVLALCLFACSPASDNAVDAEPTARAVSLVERWGDVEVDDAVPTPEAPARSELRFDGGGVDVEWTAIQGVDNLRIEDGRLAGSTSSDAPVIAFDFAEPQGADDELWSVEVRLKASAGTRLAAHPVLEPGPPMPVNVARINDWPISSAMTSTAAEAVQSFSVVLDRVFLFEMPPAQREIRRLLLRPTNAAGADFEIESVRLVFRKERLATIESGPGWHGLGEVFREAIVARVPETLRFGVTLPERPWLDLSVGTVDAASPDFVVEVATADGVETLAELGVDEVERWRSVRLDLATWAGREVELRLRTLGDAGQLGFWGAPTVRSATAPTEKPGTVILFLADTLRADHLD
ncbi:MAG: hypothetical protein AAFY88_28815, partial [Acidobacteriota bacterium]